MEKISVIIPCYNEEKAIPFFYKEIEKIRKIDFENIDFEYIFVDDGSKDNTMRIIKDLHKNDEKVKYISFSRNFGKEAAMLAGLERSQGDFVTIMDADLQDPPSLLKKMYDLIKNEGYDMVGTRRVTRKGEPPIRSFFARIFYKVINKISDTEMVDGARDYRLMKRNVVDSILRLKEFNRYSKGLWNYVGYEIKWIEYENVKRVAGETKWSLWKLFKYAIEGIIAFSTTPLVISSFIGILFCIISALLILVIIIKTMIYGDPTSGWPSLVCIIFFVSGIQLFSLGIIGQYLSRIYLEVKARPIYIVKETD